MWVPGIEPNLLIAAGPDITKKKSSNLKAAQNLYKFLWPVTHLIMGGSFLRVLTRHTIIAWDSYYTDSLCHILISMNLTHEGRLLAWPPSREVVACLL